MADGQADFAAVRPHLCRRLTALFGHRVADDSSAFVAHLYRHPTEAEFAAALAFLKRHFQFVTLDEVIGHVRDGSALPDYPLFLSFDDGFRNAYERIAPMLRAAGVPATFFLTAGAVDNRDLFPGLRRSYLIDRLAAQPDAESGALRGALQAASVHLPDGRDLIDRAARHLAIDWTAVLSAERPFLTAAEGRALLDTGFTLGAHGASHRRFAELDAASRERELAASLDFMQDVFGLQRVAFAFPHTHRGVDPAWMDQRLATDARLSLFFGTGGFAPGSRAVVHRIGLDRPTGDSGPFDIAAIIAAAYRRAEAKYGAERARDPVARYSRVAP